MLNTACLEVDWGSPQVPESARSSLGDARRADAEGKSSPRGSVPSSQPLGVLSDTSWLAQGALYVLRSANQPGFVNASIDDQDFSERAAVPRDDRYGDAHEQEELAADPGVPSITRMSGQYHTLSKYRLVARLGSGGMAEVYLALAAGPSGFKKLHVLKVLRSDIAAHEQPEFLQMFQEEGRLAARLNHPHIIQSYEVGVEGDQHFIAMEFLEGQALSRLQERSWPSRDPSGLGLELFVISEVLEGLEYAHNLTDYGGTPLHIVHRDVSPQNVFVTYTGHAKLLDFGIAKTWESSKTQAGIVKGKVPYMAPEQVRGGPLDHRVDLFAVGVMLWESAAARRMHGDSNVYEILRRMGDGAIPSLREAAPSISEELERIVVRALATEPARRYPDAHSFRRDLLEVPELRGVSAREVGARLEALFAEERSELNRVIREAMRDDTEAAIFVAEKAPVRLPELGHASDTSSIGSLSTTAPTTTPVIQTTPPPPMPAHGSAIPVSRGVRRQSVWLAGGALGLSVAAVVLWMANRDPRPEAPDIHAVNPAGSAVGTVPPVAQREPTVPAMPADSTSVVSTPPASATSLPQREAAASPEIRVRISAKPPTASLLLDGKPLGGNPYQGARTRDDKTHVLTVLAPGYQSRSIPLSFERDLDVPVVLERSTPSPSPTPRKTGFDVDFRTLNPTRSIGSSSR
ncbi:MAG TPA: protein kinase [Polyangiaceae bacterium]|nr:protein kinase [Polyangiaceae bacterium]